VGLRHAQVLNGRPYKVDANQQMNISALGLPPRRKRPTSSAAEDRNGVLRLPSP